MLLLLVCLAVTLPLELVVGARVYRRPRRLLITSLVGCDTTSPDEPEPRPDEQPAEDPADEQPADDGPDDGEVLSSYNAGARPGDTDLVVACALDQRTADPGDGEAGTDETNAADDAAEQRVTISLTPPEVMRYRLTSSTDVDGCL